MKKSRLFRILLLMFVLCMGMNARAAKTVGAKGITYKEKVTCKKEWHVRSNRDWIRVKQKKNGVKITVEENTGEERKGSVFIEYEKPLKKAQQTIDIPVVSDDPKPEPAEGEQTDQTPETPVVSAPALPAAKTVVVMRIRIRQKAYDPALGAYEYDWLATGKKDVTKTFLKKAAKAAGRLGVTPDDLMSVMAFESGLNHKAVNRISGATGLIQFLPGTAASLGTSVAALKSMSAVKQLTYVEKYLKQFGTLKNLGDLYMAILWPRAVGQPDSHPLWYSGSREYNNNHGLDVNRDGKVTRGECLAMVLRVRKQFVGE